jgi:hypothetical protein
MERFMRIGIFAALVAAAGFGLSACTSTDLQPAPQPQAQPLRTGSPADEAACLREVVKQTQNNDAAVISSEFSQANTVVIVGIGPQKAQWRCLISGGKVAEVMSLTNEGKL